MSSSEQFLGKIFRNDDTYGSRASISFKWIFCLPPGSIISKTKPCQSWVFPKSLEKVKFLTILGFTKLRIKHPIDDVLHQILLCQHCEKHCQLSIKSHQESWLHKKLLKWGFFHGHGFEKKTDGFWKNDGQIYSN